MTDYTELKQLAEAANNTDQHYLSRAYAITAFGRAANPSAVMAMVEEVEALRAVLRRVEKCTDGNFMVDGKWQVGNNVMDLVRQTLWPQPAPVVAHLLNTKTQKKNLSLKNLKKK